MRKSIIQDPEDKACYICRSCKGLEWHHMIGGTANRKLADQDGLACWLCGTCHDDLHDKGKKYKELHQIAQEAWMKRHHKGPEAFIERYGKSYI